MSLQTAVNNNGLEKELPEEEMKDFTLSNAEKDALGEIGNICMGTSATTLSTLLGKRVTITTPSVTICKGNEYLNEYEKPVVLTEVLYTQGIDGANTFLIKKEDALLITNLLMGNDENTDTSEMEEIYLSAISEVMNQMVGSSSTALASALHIQVNISPPVVRELSRDGNDIIKESDDITIVISFKMEIEDLLVSNIMQIIPFEFGKRLAGTLSGNEFDIQQQINSDSTEQSGKDKTVKEDGNTPKSGTDEETGKGNIDLKSVKFQTFNETKMDGYNGTVNNIDLIIDVPLQVTVVLGKSKKSIKEILELGMGSVIVLDRLAGDMVDVLVNGKIFARGEVVVINDNYGVRITELVTPDKLKS